MAPGAEWRVLAAASCGRGGALPRTPPATPRADPYPYAREVGDRGRVAAAPTTKLQAAYMPNGNTVDQRRTS